MSFIGVLFTLVMSLLPLIDDSILFENLSIESKKLPQLYIYSRSYVPVLLTSMRPLSHEKGPTNSTDEYE